MKHHAKPLVIVAFIATLTLTCTMVAAVSQTRNVVLTIDQDGVVHAQILTLVSEGLNNITLPTTPIVATVETYVNSTLVPSVIINNTLYVFSEGMGIARVTYVVETEESEGKFSFNITTNETVSLTIGSNIILLSLPKNIVDLKINDGNLTVVFTGPETVYYTVAEKPKPAVKPTPKQTITTTTTPTTTAQTTTTTTPTTPTTTTTSPATTPAKTPTGQEIPWWLILALLGIIGLGLALKFLRKPGGGTSVPIEVSEETRLDDIDISILKTLAERGGEMFQSELQKIIGVPKATFWRHVMRLAREGYIEIRKHGKMNRLILKKTPRWET